MHNRTESTDELPDLAAQFAAALSLWQTWKQEANAKNLDLSQCYNGMDRFMREVMRVAIQFEKWSCLHIDFEMLDEVWPYLLEDRFGGACLVLLPLDELARFDDSDCLRVAVQLRLCVKERDPPTRQ